MMKETHMQTSLYWLLAAHQGASASTLLQHAPTEPALYDHAEAILERSSQENLPVPYLGTMPLFAGPRLYEGQLSDWVLVNLAEDPLFHDRDGFPVPRLILEHLCAIDTAGIEFDALYVAHETEKGAIKLREPLTRESLLPPPPQAVAQLSDRLGRVGEAVWVVAATPLVLATVGTTAMASGALVAASVVAMAAAACMTGDPIVLGTVVAPGRPVRVGEPACWFVLGAWNYGPEA
jgi:hypothetical protein